MHRYATVTLVAALAASFSCIFSAGAEGAEVFRVVRTDGEIDPLASSLRAKSLAFRKRAGLALSIRLRVGYDDDGLWASFECEDTRLTATVVDGESPLTGEDQVRLSLWSPGGEGLEVVLSALGQVRGRRLRSGSATPLSAEELGTVKTSAIVLGDGAMFVPGTPNQDKLEAWNGTMFVPWSLLGAQGPGDGWTASFERSDYDSGTEALWAWGEGSGPLSFE